jgi:pyruvyltransferase
MKIFQYKSNNVGDTLTKPILEHFLKIPCELTIKNDTNKFIGVGSIMYAVRKNDIVWGTGLIEEKEIKIPDSVKVLAVRGKLTEKLINKNVGVYGDPALLLPLMYNPNIEQKYNVGIVPHYKDKKLFTEKIIDIEQDWKSFVNEIKQYKKIISSSLHGLIIAEAYGIPVEWKEYSNEVIGNGFKFRDYLSGTDRTSFDEPLTKEKLKEIQMNLLKVLFGELYENTRN